MKIFLNTLILLVFISCSSKKLTAEHPSIIGIDNYVADINTNNSLKKSTDKGAITDAQGFNDIGKFEYSQFYNNNALYKVHYRENTDVSIDEKYYYKDRQLVFIDATWDFKEDLKNESKKVYLINNKVVYETSSGIIVSDLLVSKGKNFLKEFNKKD